MKRGRSGTLLAWQDENGWRALSPTEINDDIRRRTRGDIHSEGLPHAARDDRGGTVPAAHRGRREQDSARSRGRRRHARGRSGAGKHARRGTKSYVDPRVIDHYAAGEVIAPTGAAETALLALLA